MSLEQGPNDKWTLEAHGYSRDKFYTKTTDGRGNSELLNVKITPYMNGILQVFIESPDFPDYRSRADVVRDALAHLLHERQVQLGDPARMAALKEATDMMLRQAEAERLIVRLENQRTFTTTLVNGMQLAQQAGNLSAMIDAVEAAERGLAHLPFKLADEVQRSLTEAQGQLKDMKKQAYIQQQMNDADWDEG